MLDSSLPIDEIFPKLEQALLDHHQLIIHAPPGAGKSTRLPLWLLNQPQLSNQKTYLIQPRRLAAANVAAYLAEQLGESVGSRIGLRTRDETKVSPQSVIEVMTEGVFVRMIQSDPELRGVGCVIFDEFHERSLSLDLGLALALQCQELLREPEQPLVLLVMSATLAAEQLQHRMSDAVLLACEGRCYPVATHYEPVPPRQDWADYLSVMLVRLLDEHSGSILIFMPGMREIRRVQQSLQCSCLPSDTDLYVLHSSLPVQEQRSVLQPCRPGRRKLVLSTNIAETSLTIDGIAVVVDTGLARVPFFDRNRGITQLKTQRISKASATQREGRAGRVQAGDCYRLWSKETQHTLLDYDVAEILNGDLSGLLLELAQWGETDCEQLVFVDSPDRHQLNYAHSLLEKIGALDKRGVISSTGRQIAQLGLHPRLAAMCIAVKGEQHLSLACLLAVLISEGDIFSRQDDIEQSIEALIGFYNKRTQPDNKIRFKANRILTLARQLQRRVDPKVSFQIADGQAVAGLLLVAFPDRVAMLRTQSERGQQLKYLMAGGQEVQLRAGSSLQQSPFLLVLDYGGDPQNPLVFKACLLSGATLDACINSSGVERSISYWDDELGSVVARNQTRIGEIVVTERQIRPSPEQLQLALLALVRDRGVQLLNVERFSAYQQRLLWAKKFTNLTLPDVSNDALLSTVEDWLGPYLLQIKTLAQLKKLCVYQLLQTQLDWNSRQSLDELAPESIALPSGRNCPIDYGRYEQPVISAKLTEFYGWKQTPTINQQKTQLLLEMLSPASRPLQLTAELGEFWQGSYRDIQKEMKGRYPKHFWPDDPANAKATVKTKRNMA